MKFHSIKARDMGHFRSIDLRFDDLSGPLIAICGDNGAGKTTLLELLTGALYRRCPTRGTLVSLARSRQAFVEVVVSVGGRSYTIKQTADAISEKSEALVLDEAGRPVLPGTGVKQYDQWAARTFPPREVLYSSIVSVQRDRGFLDLSPADRKKVLVRTLGLERIERMADAARVRARDTKGALDIARARLGELPKADIHALSSAVESAQQAMEIADQALAAARSAHDKAREAAQDADRAKELESQRRAAERRVKQAKDTLATTDERIANNKLLIARADEIRAKVARAAEARNELDAAVKALGEARLQHAEAETSEQQCRREIAQSALLIEAARDRVARAGARLKDKDKVEAAAIAIPALQARIAAGETAVRDIEAELARLERVQLNGKDERIKGLRTGLVTVCGCTDASEKAHATATGALADDDQLAEKHAAAPTETEAARKQLAVKRGYLDNTRGQLQEQERLAARAPDMEQAETDQRVATKELADATAAREMLVQAAAIAASTTAERKTSAELAERVMKGLQSELEALAIYVSDRGPKLEVATGRLAELEPQRARDAESVAIAEAELARFPAPPATGVDVLAKTAGELAQAERVARDCGTAHARAVKAHEDGETVQARRETLELEISTTSTDLSDWTRLGQDLGRDGLQALEIDCAVPELNEITNALLHECHGPRFTVTLSTQRLDADGKRSIEGLDVRVLDTQNGRDALAETYSGGECVICGEAIALALTTLACRRAGADSPTLLRDETSAWLRSENAQIYVTMLRRAATLIRADRVLFVAHLSEQEEMADARIDVSALDQGDRQLEVLPTHEPPPVEAAAAP